LYRQLLAVDAALGISGSEAPSAIERRVEDVDLVATRREPRPEQAPAAATPKVFAELLTALR